MRNAYGDAELRDIAGQQNEHGPWSQTDLLIAALWDLVAAVAHNGKGDPPQYPRPGVTSTPNDNGGGRMSRAQMAAYLKRIRREGEPPDDGT